MEDRRGRLGKVAKLREMQRERGHHNSDVAAFRLLPDTHHYRYSLEHSV